MCRGDTAIPSRNPSGTTDTVDKARPVKTIKVTTAQREVLEILSRRDISAIRRNPKLVASAKHLLAACRKTIKKLESIPEYANKKKRATAYRRIIALCEAAIEKSRD